MDSIYRRSSGVRFWHRERIEDFRYTDGSEEENRLLQIVSEAPDVGTFSESLAAAITDWPSEYHLSRARHCLLRPLPIAAGDRVLELGCGCGAITRYLGEIGARVTAVDGSPARAAIAAERCRDLPDVRVVVDDLLRFESDEAFDWVLLIGVLEYAPVFAEGEDPAGGYLRSASRYLAPQGRLVIAIENQLGLKYFNGCAEDHLGESFVGIQDLYVPRGPRTYGRRVLAGHLQRAGLVRQSFLYPFPDYKLPSVVLSDEALADPGFDAAELLARAHARDYSGNRLRGFDDALVLAQLHANGLLADLSNSFLVVAACEGGDPSTGTFAQAYAVRQRRAAHCTLTAFESDGARVRVLKRPLCPSAGHAHPTLADGTRVRQSLDEEPYVRGPGLLWRALRARAGGPRVGDLPSALAPWFDFLIGHAYPIDEGAPHDLQNLVLPGEFIDCTPANLIQGPAGWVYIDREWQADGPVQLGWLLCRGVLNTLSKGVARPDTMATIADVVDALARRHEMHADPQAIATWLQEESVFQAALTGKAVSLAPDLRPGGAFKPVFAGLRALLDRFQIGAKAARHADGLALVEQELSRGEAQRASIDKHRKALAQVVTKRDAALHRIARLNAQLAAARARTLALESSRSWRLTAPLRNVSERVVRTRR